MSEKKNHKRKKKKNRIKRRALRMNTKIRNNERKVEMTEGRIKKKKNYNTLKIKIMIIKIFSDSNFNPNILISRSFRSQTQH